MSKSTPELVHLYKVGGTSLGITVSKKIRRKLGLKKGQALLVRISEGQIVLQPVN